MRQKRGPQGVCLTFRNQSMTKPNRRRVTELDRAINAYGRTIYVEEWEDHNGRPKIWYEFDRQNILIKSVRKPFCIGVTTLGKTRYIKC